MLSHHCTGAHRQLMLSYQSQPRIPDWTQQKITQSSRHTRSWSKTCYRINKNSNHHSKFSCLCPWFTISIVAFEDDQISMNIANYELIVLFKVSQQQGCCCLRQKHSLRFCLRQQQPLRNITMLQSDDDSSVLTLWQHYKYCKPTILRNVATKMEWRNNWLI